MRTGVAITAAVAIVAKTAAFLARRLEILIPIMLPTYWVPDNFFAGTCRTRDLANVQKNVYHRIYVLDQVVWLLLFQEFFGEGAPAHGDAGYPGGVGGLYVVG